MANLIKFLLYVGWKKITSNGKCHRPKFLAA